jgi:hypothetical protein
MAFSGLPTVMPIELIGETTLPAREAAAVAAGLSPAGR